MNVYKNNLRCTLPVDVAPLLCSTLSDIIENKRYVQRIACAVHMQGETLKAILHTNSNR